MTVAGFDPRGGFWLQSAAARRCAKCERRFRREHPVEARLLTALAESLGAALLAALGKGGDGEEVERWCAKAHHLFVRSGESGPSAAVLVTDLLQAGLAGFQDYLAGEGRAPELSYRCRVCGQVTHQPQDVASGYCAVCHAITRWVN